MPGNKFINDALSAAFDPLIGGVRSLYYDRAGKPVSREVFAVLFDNMQYRQVGLDKIGDVMISTVWLGINHQFNSDGPPIVFETLVTGVNDGDEEMYRYATDEEARRGHAALVAKYKAELDEEEAKNDPSKRIVEL